MTAAIINPLVLLLVGWAFGYLFFGVPRLSLKDDDEWNLLVQQIAEGDADEWQHSQRPYSSDGIWLHSLAGITVKIDSWHFPSSRLLGAYSFAGPTGKPLPLCRAARLSLMRSIRRAKRVQAERTRQAEMMAVAEKLRRVA